jgi:hypothetical protein
MVPGDNEALIVRWSSVRSVGRSAGRTWPDGVIGPTPCGRHDACMQLIQSTHVLRPARGPLLVGTIVGSVLLVGGLGLAWLAFATPIVRGLAPGVVRPTLDQMLIGGLVWGLSLVVPPCLAIVGTIRLSVVAATVLRPPKNGPVASVGDALGDEYVVAPSVRLPDGRLIRNVVVGPFGVAIIGELPSPKNLRRHGSSWEIRRMDGRWAPLESPLEHAMRDAERIRHWLAAEDRDFLVKVYSAVVVGNQPIPRTAACAALADDQIPAWLASLPPQRSLNADRQADIVDRIRSIA